MAEKKIQPLIVRVSVTITEKDSYTRDLFFATATIALDEDVTTAAKDDVQTLIYQGLNTTTVSQHIEALRLQDEATHGTD